MATLFQVLQFFDNNGDPLASGEVYWYIAGTTTFKDTYVDQAESSAAPNPIVLDSEGRPPLGGIWLDGSYKMVLKDSDSVTIVTLDNINEYNSLDWTGLTATIADLNSTTTTALTKNSDYTVVVGDRNKTILANAASGIVNISLPAAATAGNKFRIYIKKTDVSTNKVLVKTNLTETIDAEDDYTLWDYNDMIGLQCDGSNWFIIAAQLRGYVATETTSQTPLLPSNRRLILMDATGGARAVNLPDAAVVGRGYTIKVKKTDSSSNAVTITPSGAQKIDGAGSLVIQNQYVTYELVTDGSNWFIEDEYGLHANPKLPWGYLSGFVISQDSGDTDHDIDTGTGECRDTSDTVNMKISTALIKKIDTEWVAGTNQGGRPSAVALAATTWYHFFIIRDTSGVVDAGFDTSVTASNLLSTSTYTYYRYVGSVYTDSSLNITDFLYFETGGKRLCLWKTPTLDIDTTNPGTSAVLQTLIAPLGIETTAMFNMNFYYGGIYPNEFASYMYISHPGVDDDVASLTVAPLLSGSNTFEHDGEGADWQNLTIDRKIEELTNTASQIRTRITASDANTALKISTLGWYY